jgi:hypothetical protein
MNSANWLRSRNKRRSKYLITVSLSFLISNISKVTIPRHNSKIEFVPLVQ